MSTKSSILLTNDSEHWYSDCSEHLNDKDDAITLEFSKKNIRIDANDEWDLVITITNPDSELFEAMKKVAKLLRGY